jgi:hypothetical protein
LEPVGTIWHRDAFVRLKMRYYREEAMEKEIWIMKIELKDTLGKSQR